MNFLTREKFFKKISRNKLLIAGIAAVILFLFLPVVRFKVPYSVVIESDDGMLLGAKIAADGQWRFPPGDSVPEKFRKCIIRFEDQKFYYHPGVDPFSLIRAMG